MIKGGSNILNVYAEESGEMHSLFIGQAMALFGEPDYMTKDYENIFTTSIMAVNEDGETVYLYVYHGPSGPAIGGKNDEKSRSAAN